MSPTTATTESSSSIQGVIVSEETSPSIWTTLEIFNYIYLVQIYCLYHVLYTFCMNALIVTSYYHLISEMFILEFVAKSFHFIVCSFQIPFRLILLKFVFLFYLNIQMYNLLKFVKRKVIIRLFRL